MKEDRKLDYELLEKQAEALLSGQSRVITNAANLSAFIFEEVPELNWAGFYFVEEDTLWLGPFQGKVACTRIPVGQGVCGTAVKEETTQRVDDVHAFPGHIACDTASNSELVIPLFNEAGVFAVLDLDSPVTQRFTVEDERGMERLARVFERSIES